MSFHILVVYFLTWTLVALTPGPAVMCSMTQATRHGFRASLAGITGIQVGNFLFFVLVAFGLGTLLAKATTVFNILRVVGALYLAYIGIQIVVASMRRTDPPSAKYAALPAKNRSLFLQGLLVQLTNPKALLFVSALLPQFLDSQRSAPPQLAILVLTTVLVDFVVLSAYAFLAARGVESFRQSLLASWLERVLGATLVFFGFRLLCSRK